MKEMYRTEEGQLTNSVEQVYVVGREAFKNHNEARLFEQTGIKNLEYPKEYAFEGVDFEYPELDGYALEITYFGKASKFRMTFKIANNTDITLEDISYWDRCSGMEKFLDIGKEGFNIKGRGIEEIANGNVEVPDYIFWE